MRPDTEKLAKSFMLSNLIYRKMMQKDQIPNLLKQQAEFLKIKNAASKNE
jgi:hypothetical protein